MAGNIAKRPNGKWRARYRDEAGDERARALRPQGRRPRWLDESADGHVRHLRRPSGREESLSSEFYDGWAAAAVVGPFDQGQCRPGHGSRPSPNLPMKAIRWSHVEAWVKAMSTPSGPARSRARFVIVRSVFRAAVAIGDRKRPASAWLPRRRKAEAAMRIPSVEEVGQLLAHADGPASRLARASRRMSRSAPSPDSARAKPLPFRSARSTSCADARGRSDSCSATAATTRSDHRDGSEPHRLPSGRAGHHPQRARRRPRRSRPDAAGSSPSTNGDATTTRLLGHRAPRAPQPRSSHVPLHDLRPLLRLRPDSPRLRRRHRPARARPLDCDDHAEHLQPPLADRRSPHPQGGPVV